MPTLTNPKHELFAEELAKGKTATEAYVLAGYKYHDGNCIRLRGNERIRERVAELLAASAERAEITVESLQREAADLQRKAAEANQFSAASGLLKLKSVFAGLYVEKRENTNTNSVRELTDQEIADRLTNIRGRASDGNGASPLSPSKPH